MINKSETTERGLVEYIKEYESDTFSASGWEITDAEAVRVARRLIQWFIDNRLDGVLIADIMDDLRPEPEEAEEMDINKVINTADEAEEYAKDWQRWSAEQSLSYGELAEWGAKFTELAERFDLREVFEENGII